MRNLHRKQKHQGGKDVSSDQTKVDKVQAEQEQDSSHTVANKIPEASKTQIETKKKKETTTYRVKTIRGGRGVLIRLRRARADYKFNTKKTLEKAIKNLEELAEEAHKRATSKYLPTEERQKWAKIEAYLYQTIASISKTYDLQQIEEKLEEMNRHIEEIMEKP